MVKTFAFTLGWDQSSDQSYTLENFLSTIMAGNARPAHLLQPDKTKLPAFHYQPTLAWGDFINYMANKHGAGFANGEFLSLTRKQWTDWQVMKPTLPDATITTQTAGSPNDLLISFSKGIKRDATAFPLSVMMLIMMALL